METTGLAAPEYSIMTELDSKKSFPSKIRWRSNSGRRIRQFCSIDCSSPLSLYTLNDSTICPSTASLLQWLALLILKFVEVFNLEGLIFNVFQNLYETRVKVDPVSRIHSVNLPLTLINSKGPELARWTENSTVCLKVHWISTNSFLRGQR